MSELDIAVEIARFAADAPDPRWASTQPAVSDMAVEAEVRLARAPSKGTPLNLGRQPVSVDGIPVLQAVSITQVVPPAPAPVRAAAQVASFTDVKHRKPPAVEATPAPPVVKVPVPPPAPPAPVKAAAPQVAVPAVPSAAPVSPVSSKGQETVHLPRGQTSVNPVVPRPSGGTLAGGAQGFKLGDFDVRPDPVRSR